MSAAHKSESPAATGLHAANQNTDTADFKPDQKRLATVIAQLALAGHEVHRLETGYAVSRWGLTKFCPDFDALVTFASVLGVQP